MFGGGRRMAQGVGEFDVVSESYIWVPISHSANCQLITANLIRAFPSLRSGQAIHSYCAGISHKAGIHCCP